MIVRRFNTGKPMVRFRAEVDDLFGDLFGSFSPQRVFDNAPAALLPAVNLRDTEDAVLVEVELPGVEPKEIEITVENETLTIAGEKKECSEHSTEHYTHVERRFGSFRRDIALPSSVDTEKIEAKHDKGVLSIRLPKRESAVPKRIEVKVD